MSHTKWGAQRQLCTPCSLLPQILQKRHFCLTPDKVIGPSKMELMGGVEQIRNSETVEISRKERRPSHGVSKSVSKNLLYTIFLLTVFRRLGQP